MMKRLVFLKLGGSVITDKDRPNSANLEKIDEIANEIAQAQKEDPDLSLLIGHGSGSFGHHAAKRFGTRNGVSTRQDWQGFVEVAARARELNQIVIEHLRLAGNNILSISPFSSVQANNHEIVTWDTTVLEGCLQKGVVPVIYGDVILDRQLGGTILSTEELFAWLAVKLHPDKILLAGLEEGVWKNFPNRAELYSEINPENFQITQSEIQTSKSIDVTGGMYAKVQDMVALVRILPSLETQVFSAVQPGNVYSTLLGVQKGTLIRSSKG